MVSLLGAGTTRMKASNSIETARAHHKQPGNKRHNKPKQRHTKATPRTQQRRNTPNQHDPQSEKNITTNHDEHTRARVPKPPSRPEKTHVWNECTFQGRETQSVRRTKKKADGEIRPECDLNTDVTTVLRVLHPPTVSDSSGAWPRKMVL